MNEYAQRAFDAANRLAKTADKAEEEGKPEWVVLQIRQAAQRWDIIGEGWKNR